ncbi:MAG: hypothetical protein ABIP93_14560 [Gemmatimonadaceae bacterium]
MKQIASNVLIALAYAIAYVVCYVYFLNFHFGYFGFELYPQSTAFLALSIGLSVIPVLCYRGLRAISSVLATFTYLLLYVPIVLTFALGSNRSPVEIFVIQSVFLVCMCLIFMADLIVVKSPFDLRLRIDLAKWVLVLTAVCTLYVLFVYRSNLRFVSFADVYEQRFENADLGQGLVARYVAAWLYSVMIPLCLAYGLVSRRYTYFWIGSAACVTIYMATAAKGAVVLPVVYLGFFLLFARNRLRGIFGLLTASMAVTIGLLTLVQDTTSVMFWVSSIVLMRTIGTAGLLTRTYYDFFLTHPRTYYTHIGLIGKVSGAYPFDVPVGQAVGQYYWSWDMNANANFWATDGIAAMGMVGVVVSTVLCVLLFGVLNTVTRTHNKLFVALCFLPFLVQLFNTSLLSSIWSGGGLLLIVFFLLSGEAEGATPIRPDGEHQSSATPA